MKTEDDHIAMMTPRERAEAEPSAEALRASRNLVLYGPATIALFDENDRRIARAMDAFAAKAVAQERERCAQVADRMAERAADSAQVVMANGTEQARHAQPGSVRVIVADVRDKQNYLHGKRHSAAEIAAAIREEPELHRQ